MSTATTPVLDVLMYLKNCCCEEMALLRTLPMNLIKSPKGNTDLCILNK